MVERASHRGLHEWLAQRVTAILIGAYAIFIFVYLLRHQPIYYAQWHQLFHRVAMKAATFIVLLSVMWHAWIGLWTVFTDYVKQSVVRLILEILVILLLLGYLAWCFEIFWMSYR